MLDPISLAILSSIAKGIGTLIGVSTSVQAVSSLVGSPAIASTSSIMTNAAATTSGAASSGVAGLTNTEMVVAGVAGVATLGTSAYVVKKLKDLEKKYKDAELKAEAAIEKADKHKKEAEEMRKDIEIEQMKASTLKTEMDSQSAETKRIKESCANLYKRVSSIETEANKHKQIAIKLETEARSLKQVAQTYKDTTGTDEERLNRMIAKQEELLVKIVRVSELLDRPDSSSQPQPRSSAPTLFKAS